LRSTTLWLAPLGLAIFFGVAPGCGGGNPDLAARLINAQNRAQQLECDCDVASGDYSSHAECSGVEFIAEPIPDAGCLAQALRQYPEDVAAVECQVGSHDAVLDCVAGVGCGGDSSRCGVPGEGCPPVSDAFEAALEACQFPDPADLGSRVVRSRDRSNDALCACIEYAEANCQNLVRGYDATCLALLAQGSEEAHHAIVCELAAYADYFVCMREPGVCDTSRCAAALFAERAGGLSCDGISDPTLAAIESCDLGHQPMPDLAACANLFPVAGTAGGALTISPIDATTFWLQVDLAQLGAVLDHVESSTGPPLAIAEAVIPALFFLDQSWRDDCEQPEWLALRFPFVGLDAGTIVGWQAGINAFLVALAQFPADRDAQASNLAFSQCLVAEETLGALGAALMGCEF
jgi:hypothetical protein